MKTITQEHPLGCGVACVASVLNISYKKAHALMNIDTTQKGAYCSRIARTLRKHNKNYRHQMLKPKTPQNIKQGTIVFTQKSKRYPMSHYFVKTDKGWMNPWINFPHIKPAKAGVEKELKEKIQWIIYTTT